MNIGPKTIKLMKDLACDQIDMYAADINKAFLKADGERLKISMGIDLSLSPIKADSVDVDTTISFTAEKIKNRLSGTVSETQMELPLGVTTYKLEK